MIKELEGKIYISLKTGKGVDGGREIRQIPFTMIVIGSLEIDISEEIEILMEKHSEVLEKAIADDDRRVDQSILSDRAAAQYENLRN